jgi:hypothetical protein
VLRVKCPEHGVKLVDVPWVRKDGAFALLFEQAVLTPATHVERVSRRWTSTCMNARIEGLNGLF